MIRVAPHRKTRVDSWLVSTVRLTMLEDPEPFETMVFLKGPDPWRDWYCERRSTLEEALADHDRLVKELQAGDFSSLSDPT